MFSTNPLKCCSDYFWCGSTWQENLWHVILNVKTRQAVFPAQWNRPKSIEALQFLLHFGTKETIFILKEKSWNCYSDFSVWQLDIDWVTIKSVQTASNHHIWQRAGMLVLHTTTKPTTTIATSINNHHRHKNKLPQQHQQQQKQHEQQQETQ